MKLLLMLVGGGLIFAGLFALPVVPEWALLVACLAWLFGCFAAGVAS